MKSYVRTLLTIITEAALEGTLVGDIERLGASGYTIVDARGKGDRGVRDAGWEASSSIRIEVMCDAGTADAISEHLQQNYYSDYAMVLFACDVNVPR